MYILKTIFLKEIYFKFEVDKQHEEIKLLYIDSNHNKLENSIKIF